jgi:hypothetical protein
MIELRYSLNAAPANLRKVWQAYLAGSIQHKTIVPRLTSPGLIKKDTGQAEI